MMAFCSFWYALKTGQNFAAWSAVSVRFFAMMSALLLCMSARRAFIASSTVGAGALVVVVCCAGACAGGGATAKHATSRYAGVRCIAILKGGRGRKAMMNPRVLVLRWQRLVAVDIPR